MTDTNGQFRGWSGRCRPCPGGVGRSWSADLLARVVADCVAEMAGLRREYEAEKVSGGDNSHPRIGGGGEHVEAGDMLARWEGVLAAGVGMGRVWRGEETGVRSWVECEKGGLGWRIWRVSSIPGSRDGCQE